MKKIILIVMLMLGIAFTSNAQNANRSGIFFDVAPGCTFRDDGCSSMSTTLDIGYRWAFNTHLALDAKLKASIPFDDPGYLGIGIMPGLRYTSAELGNSNKSIYASVGLGFNFLVGVLYDAEFGLNLSNHFYLGLKHDGYSDYYHAYCGTIGVCLGYRF